MTKREHPWINTYGTEIDDATGMPVVPEGFFWRVKRGGFYRLNVQLRQKFLWVLSLEVDSCPTDDGSEWGVSNIAAYILHKWEERNNRVTGTGVRHLLGDYPPKKLGNN